MIQMNNIIIQLIGIVAYIFLIISYQRKNKKEILLFHIIAAIFFAIHFYLLNGITGSICNIIGAFMMLIIYFFEKKNYKNKSILFLILIPVLVLITVLTYDNIYSILPIIASLIVLIGFLLKDENKIRLIGMISDISWLIYGIIYLSYPAIVFETITIISIIIAIINNKKKVIK